MPKANVVFADGTKVTIEGTTEEVATLLQRISTNAPSRVPGGDSSRSRRRRAKSAGDGTERPASHRTAAKGPVGYIRELVRDDYFKTKRGLGDVQKKLEEGAHIYAVTHLSPALTRLVRAKELRRIKEGGTWKYVNP
jgi:hypothetical protein